MVPLRLAAILLVAGLLIPSGLSAKTDKGPFYYLSPLPGADHASAQSTLIFRPGAELRGSGWMNEVVVRGKQSGIHSGRWISVSDQKTFIFKPDSHFSPGERVRVSVGENFRYSFLISPEGPDHEMEPQVCSCFAPAEFEPTGDRGKQPAGPQKLTRNWGPGYEEAMNLGYELPETFPELKISVLGNTAPGYIFLGTRGPRFVSYMMIVDNSGAPVFFRALPGSAAPDFKLQPNGLLSYCDVASASHHLMDNTYTVVDTVRFIGYNGTNFHDLRALPNGNYLVQGNQNFTYDMSELVEGGNPEATMVVNIIQEVDADDNVVFEWRSWDHFDIFDAVDYDFTQERLDPVHINSIELDHDGNIIVSSRNMDITKINRDTGDIIWRMGGKRNQFTLIGDTQWFSRQHSVRRLDNGHLTVYDNGNLNDPQESRAVEYEVDEQNMTATLVWEYRDDPPVFGAATGNVQRLPNGNTIIGWGRTTPNVAEVQPDGTKVFHLELPRGLSSYRAFRFEWTGNAARPDLWATTGDNSITLNFTKFGDENVSGYNIYRGDEPDPTEIVGTTTRNQYPVHNYEAGKTMYFRVQSIDGAGIAGPFSNEIEVTPDTTSYFIGSTLRVTPRTLNLKSKGNWISARMEFVDDCHCLGSNPSEIVLNGSVYADRVTVTDDGETVTGLDIKFPRDQVTQILSVGDEAEVRVSGRIGDASFEATDYIRIVEPGKSSPSSGGDQVAGRPALHQNLPNPFNPTTVIRYTVPTPGGQVTIQVFDVAGRLVRTLADGVVPAGDATVTWDGRDARGERVSSGVYFYRLTVNGAAQTRKMVLMK